MNMGTALSRIIKLYEKAQKDETINKPISWSIYQTWKWADTYERGRHDTKGKRKVKQPRDNERS